MAFAQNPVYFQIYRVLNLHVIRYSYLGDVSEMDWVCMPYMQNGAEPTSAYIRGLRRYVPADLDIGR